MISLEQVKLLESKVSRAIDYIKKVTEEKDSLKAKLIACQKRIDELEILIQRFKEDQGRIEDGILSALDKLNQFEDALETRPQSESRPGNEFPAENNPPPVNEDGNSEPVSDMELDIF